MFKTLRKSIGNFLVTFISHEVNLWVSDKPPPKWGYYWANTADEAVDILSCYFVAKCVLSGALGLEVVEFLSKKENEMFWPILRPEVDHRAVFSAALEKWLYIYGPYFDRYREGR